MLKYVYPVINLHGLMSPYNFSILVYMTYIVGLILKYPICRNAFSRYIWVYGVVVSTYVFHHGDQGLNAC